MTIIVRLPMNIAKSLIKAQIKITYDISPYPTVVMVTTAHQNPSGMDLKCDAGFPASAKYTVLENRTTPINNNKY